jgi:hypothetical protein
VDLDTAADELYGISPDDFIERRQQLVAGAKQAGDRQATVSWPPRSASFGDQPGVPG